MVGSGGAGNVWAAVDEVLERRVAVKDVGAPPWLSVESWQALRERTLREARAAAAISHPNVVTVYDVVEEDERPWIVMQLVEARTLSQIIDEEGPCEPRRAAEIGLQVLSALQAAHAHGILHRDVKPSNVLVGDDGRAVLTDFGIASVDGDVALTASGVLVGAPAYIAPERVRGGVAGPASDLWSLGATLYTTIEGRPPYQRDTAICTITAVVHEDPDPISKASVLTPLLDALLRKDPEQRPNAAEVEGFLRAIVASAPAPDSELGAELAPADVARSETRPVPLPLASAVTTEMAVTSANAMADTGPRTASRPRVLPQPPAQPPRLPILALLTAAATVLLAIMLTGYLVRHTLETGTPTNQQTNEQPAGPEPVLDRTGRSSAPSTGEATRVPSRGGRATSTTGTPAPVRSATSEPQASSSQPPAEATPTSATQPQPTTTVEPPTTTPVEPTASGQATNPSVLP